MDAINKMIERLNEQAEQERQLFKQEQLTKIEATFDQEQARLFKEKEAHLKSQEQLIEKKYKQQRDRQQVAYRQESLHEKQRVLTKLFEEAAKEMNEWSKEETQQFSEQLLKGLNLEKSWVIKVGALSSDALDQAWVDTMVQRYQMAMTLSTETVPKQAGFVLQDNGVQYNFIFENLVKDVQPTMSYELAERLFD